MNKIIVAVLVLVIALLGVACSPTCASQSEEFLGEIQDINQRWSDALELANSTSRMSLAGPIAELQSIRRDAINLEPPECAEGAQTALVTHMGYVLDGFLMFMAQEPEEDVSAQFDEAWDWMDIYSANISKIQKN